MLGGSDMITAKMEQVVDLIADSPLEGAGFEPSVPEPRNVRSRALSGQTAVTIAGARRLIRSTNSEADRQARPLVINARGNLR